MKIFVTGSEGYFGKPLAAKLSQNYKIVGHDIVNGQDILNYEQLKTAMSGCEMVIHSAAIPKPDETKTFDDYFQTNCVGTLNVAKAAIENKLKRMIYISSTAYYGVERGIPVKFPLKENQQTVPMYLKADDLKCRDCDMMYSQSKIIAENILAFYGLTKKIQVVILRFPRIGDLDGPYGTKVSISNAIQGTEKAIAHKGVLWYDAFTMADKLPNVNISKAQKILEYKPN